MLVFVSWSGSLSRAVAEALRDWLPHILDVQPWISSSDILPGDQWFVQLSQRLERVDFGIVCLTKANRDAPWLLFESGALLNSLGRGRVIPYLIDCSPDDVTGPLNHFQAASR